MITTYLRYHHYKVIYNMHVQLIIGNENVKINDNFQIQSIFLKIIE